MAENGIDLTLNRSNKEIVEDKNIPESSGIKRRFWDVLKFVSRI